MSGSAHFDTFPAEAMSLPDFEISAAWRTEINHRAREIDVGTVQTLPHEEVMRRAREVIANGRRK